ncbi:Uroporphyrinogen decarboxylase 1, chloroplastic [Linum grandiflorum]
MNSPYLNSSAVAWRSSSILSSQLGFYFSNNVNRLSLAPQCLHLSRRGFRVSCSSTSSNDPLLVKAARGESVDRPPAWMMRQAGRYMAVYRKLAEKYPSFRERSETTDLIVEISLQPWEAFRPDGVIIFSDILTPLPAFGVSFDIEDVEGQAAVLGFVGSPWTIGTYIVEGGMTRTYTTIKSMCHTAPHVLKALLTHLTQAIADYAVFQVESGAHCIQIFDSWGGQLSPAMWEIWSKPYLKEVRAGCISSQLHAMHIKILISVVILQIVSTVKSKCPGTPLVLYINGNGGLLERMKDIGVDVIGLDWTVDMADGRKRLGNEISVQGNVDPAYLFLPLPAITDEIHRVVSCAGPKGHILNLGHGVLVGTPEEAVAHFFDVTKSLDFSSSFQAHSMAAATT